MTAACLTAVLTITSVFSFTPAAVSHAASEDLEATKGAYWFAPHITPTDLTDNYIYSDKLLRGDSLKYNSRLATMSYELAVMSISSEREPKTAAGYRNKSRNLKAYLEDNGFVDFDTNEDYRKKMTTRTMGAACAHKKIKDGGKTYTLLAIVPRSAGYEAEWGGNFMLGESGDHEGFRLGKEKVLAYAKEYIKKYKIKGNIKVWTAGYSRGAGVTNQVGAAILRDPKAELGSSVTLKPGNFYCYTFGTPNSAGTDTEDYQDSKFDYIHNVWESYDITTAVPFEILGFARYGTNYTYADKGDEERMLKLMKMTNKDVYDAYTTVGDPKFFRPKKLDVDALIQSGEFSFIDDDDSYLPDNQKEFAAMLANTAGVVFRSRADFKENYQDAVEDLGGYYYSHLEKSDKLMEGIMGSKYAIPAAVSIYLAYMADRYRDYVIPPAEREELEKWIEEFQKYIEKAIEEGAEIPQDIREKMAELAEQVNTVSRLGLLVDVTSAISAFLYTRTLADGLTNAGLPEEDKDLFDRMTSSKAGKAVSRVAAYFLLYDERQEEGITFSYLNQQFKHLATLIGNAGSYQRPHNNEVILSWLRTLDPSYDDFRKETAAQTAGYRRVYIKQPSGVTVTGTVKDGSGKTVARFKNGKITSRTDKWVGITTCDKGNWLRLPLDKTYKVVISPSRKAKLKLKVTEYSVYNNKEVRKVTKDSNYNWKKLTVRPEDKTTLVVSKVSRSGGKYKLKSKAKYYIDIVKPVLTPKTASKGNNAVKVSWSKVNKATRYSVYYRPCSGSGKAVKIKSLRAGTLSFVKKGLKKGKAYKFRITAERKEKGKYRRICSSYTVHCIAGNKGGRFTNVRSLKLNKTKVTLKAGKTFRIRPKAKPYYKNYKLLSKVHAPLYRYMCNDTGVASVSKKGVIRARRTGTCKVSVVTVSGLSKTVKVVVK